MAKAAIVTLYGETNFGNRLQNFALETFLRSFDIKCESLIFCKKQPLAYKTKRAIKKCMGLFGLKKTEINREASFKRFSKKHISTRKIPIKYDLNKLSEEYDFFIAGSDQVWNPSFGNFDSIFNQMFLVFAPKDKRIAFSPSFGVEHIPSPWIEKFRKGLLGFEYLSCREESGLRIIEELTGEKAPLIADPTLLVPIEEWIKLTELISENNPQSVCYFLGDKPSIAFNNDSFIDVLDKKSGNYYSYNPSDFLSLIRNAKMVYTDSFHACVFSIMFGTPFCVYQRKGNGENMFSRIETLLKLFGIERIIPGNPIEVDPATKDRVLSKLRADATDYVLKFLYRKEI